MERRQTQIEIVGSFLSNKGLIQFFFTASCGFQCTQSEEWKGKNNTGIALIYSRIHKSFVNLVLL